MDFLDRTRDGYDAAATEFAAMFENYLDDKPIEKALLAAFAELVRDTGNTSVADVGCGTGVTTRILADLGVEPTGIDLSPNMIAEARARAPELRFEVGSMTSLELANASVGGVCAWYSTIHVPGSHLPQAFSEFHRVLVDGGVALLAFQVGDRPRRLTEAFGTPLDLEFVRREPGAVAATLEAAGLPVYSTTVREPDDDGVQTTPQAFLVACKRSAR
ncbi:class I SAM-dependent methyltransferase [Mycobacterium hodleri]|uniref:Class I SAM-dependent methyltransferase n=1 Tax=Mycolicibacterium hodleri TaxID=49897 RepID=A0A544W5X8_9MYCO|nr:class I SAM-dependent methyltransferase [Mycolicibacterium hodleri]TQR87629.1 class I SAM-dependent methyltransferase [Mycolicibacterium hodleri]